MQIERWRGDTRPDEFTVFNTTNQQPANITGCIFVMTLSRVVNPIDSSTVIYQLSGALTDPQNGIVQFLPSVDQANLVGYFYFDVQMTDTYGLVHTLVKGTYVYHQDITK